MKVKHLFTTALTGLFAILAVSCEKGEGFDPNGEATLLNVASDGITVFAADAKNNIVNVLNVTASLTSDEVEFLYAMREDEKLSKDLYTAFAAQYPTYQQFSNMATAEATHITTVEKILTYYEIEFPALGEAGVFADEERQQRYNDLLSKGATALDAFMVIAEIEEESVAAYKTLLATAENANIKLLLENMVKSSSNHLKAAVHQITNLGGTYTPSVLDQASFDEIINSSFQQGNKYAYRHGKGNGQHANTNSGKGGQGQGKKGSVNKNGTCTEINSGTCPGTGSNGQLGKKYRGGR